MSELDDLIYRCGQGKRDAMEKIYRMFFSSMFAVCLRLSNTREEAEDHLQDGFMKVFDAIGSYKGAGSFEGWMKRIFANVCLEKLRMYKKISLVDKEIEFVPELSTEDIEDVVIEDEVLQGFVKDLPERYRMVFCMYVIDGLSHRDISTAMGISDGTSKSNLSRAREILKRRVNEYLKNG